MLPFENRGQPYFEDGNIILITDESPTSFRVHRGVLARHSEVFQSMVQIPQPSKASDDMYFDGCQVVCLYDPPNEVSSLLKALYDGVTFINTNIMDFYHLAGILRLSTKYFIRHLRDQAIRALTETWAYSLSGHDRMVETALASPAAEGLSYPYVHPLHVLNLALETHVRIILPSIFYFLSLYPLEDLLKADHPKLQVEHPSKPSSMLPPDAMKDYTLMYQHRLDAILEFVHRICGERSKSTNCVACAKGFRRLTSQMSLSWVTRTGPFHYMKQAIDSVRDDSTFCESCKQLFITEATAFREESWRKLPSVIALASWGDLESDLRDI